MKVGDLDSHPADVILGHLVVLQQFIQCLFPGKLSHFHGIFNRLTASFNFEGSILLTDRYDTPIHLGREAAVESHLLKTVEVALLQRRKIQKTVVHRLFHFINSLSGEKEIRDMGLKHADVPHPIRIGLWPHQGPHQQWMTFRNGVHCQARDRNPYIYLYQQLTHQGGTNGKTRGAT